jgi:hypothetical protein
MATVKTPLNGADCVLATQLGKATVAKCTKGQATGEGEGDASGPDPFQLTKKTNKLWVIRTPLHRGAA